MAIKVARDVGVPGGVALADYLTERLDEGRAAEETKYNPIVGMVFAIAGYALTAFGIGGDYTKNLGIASMDWGVRGFRTMVVPRITGAVSGRTGSRLTMRHRMGASERTTYPVFKPEEEVLFSVT